MAENRGPLSCLVARSRLIVKRPFTAGDSTTSCCRVCRLGPEGGLLRLFLLRSYKMKPSVSKRLLLLQSEDGSDALERQRAKYSSQFRSKNKSKNT